MRKVLKIVVFALVLVIVAEIGFYYYLTQESRTSAPRIEQPSPATISTQPVEPTVSIAEYEPAYNSLAIDQLKFTKANGHVSTRIVERFEGTIHSFAYPKVQTANGVEDGYALLLQGEGYAPTDDMNFFYLPTTSFIFPLEVIEQTGDVQTPLTAEDLEVGDYVIIDLTIDLAQPVQNGVVDYRITRTNNLQ